MKRLWILLLAILYLLSPYDLLPDFLFGAGWLDDLSLIGILAYYYFYRQRKQAQAGKRSGDREDFQAKREEAPSSQSPHEVLGIAENATSEEIKAAYRRLANQYHPDKVSHLGEEFRVLAERKFKEIQRAYQQLTR